MFPYSVKIMLQGLGKTISSQSQFMLASPHVSFGFVILY